MLPSTPARDRSIESLRQRADDIRDRDLPDPDARGSASSSRGIRAGRTRWTTSSGCSPTSTSCTATAALPTTTPSSPVPASYKGQPVAFVGHQKGRDTKQKIYRNFGYARPEGYRKAMRVMTMAQKFSRPIVVFIDTPAAYPGMESEERGVAEAIAWNLREMMMIEVPIIVIVCGEGGSGGALGIAIGDRVLMQEFSVYSVIPPEGLRRDPVARRQQEGRGGDGAQDHRARPGRARPRRRHHSRAARRRPQRLRRGRRRWSIRRCRRRWRRSAAMTVARAARRALREVPQDGRREGHSVVRPNTPPADPRQRTPASGP